MWRGKVPRWHPQAASETSTCYFQEPDAGGADFLTKTFERASKEGKAGGRPENPPVRNAGKAASLAALLSSARPKRPYKPVVQLHAPTVW